MRLMYQTMFVRFLLLSSLCLCRPAFSFAQPFPTSEDTLDARGSIPLQVGNTWEYVHRMHRPPWVEQPIDRSEVRRERYTLVDSLVLPDTVFYTLVFEEQSEPGTLLRRDTARVWYEESAASLRAKGYAGILERLTCLDADFGSHDNFPSDCSPFVRADAVSFPELFQDEVVDAKVFASYVWSHVVVHGVGLVSHGGGCEPCDPFSDTDHWGLAFAVVGGNTYGHPVVNLDIKHGGARRVPVPLDVWPNPSRGMINIQTSGGEVVRVYDMLGREMARIRASVAGFDQLDLTALPPGTYAVVAGRAVTTVVLL
jgi:hypothetical protein